MSEVWGLKMISTSLGWKAAADWPSPPPFSWLAFFFFLGLKHLQVRFKDTSKGVTKRRRLSLLTNSALVFYLHITCDCKQYLPASLENLYWKSFRESLEQTLIGQCGEKTRIYKICLTMIELWFHPTQTPHQPFASRAHIYKLLRSPGIDSKTRFCQPM